MGHRVLCLLFVLFSVQASADIPLKLLGVRNNASGEYPTLTSVYELKLWLAQTAREKGLNVINCEMVPEIRYALRVIPGLQDTAPNQEHLDILGILGEQLAAENLSCTVRGY